MNITIKQKPRNTMGNCWSKLYKTRLFCQKSALLRKKKKGWKGSFGH